MLRRRSDACESIGRRRRCRCSRDPPGTPNECPGRSKDGFAQAMREGGKLDWNRKPVHCGRPRRLEPGRAASEPASETQKGSPMDPSGRRGTARLKQPRGARCASARDVRQSQEHPLALGSRFRLGRAALVALLPSGSSP